MKAITIILTTIGTLFLHRNYIQATSNISSFNTVLQAYNQSVKKRGSHIWYKIINVQEYSQLFFFLFPLLRFNKGNNCINNNKHFSFKQKTFLEFPHPSCRKNIL